MVQKFVLTAELALNAPRNLSQVAKQIRSGLKNIDVDVNVRISSKSLQNLKTLQAALSSLRASVATTSATINAVGTTATKTSSTATTAMNKISSSTNQASRSVNTLHKNVQVATTEVAEFGRASALAVRRFLAFSIPAGIIVGLVVNIRQGIKAAVDFNRELLRVRQVTGRTSEGISGLRSEVFRLGTTLGVPSAELIKVSRILSQAGLSADKTKVALESLAKVSLAPTFEGWESTAEGAIAAMNQFDIEAENLEATMGSLNAVAGSFAVEFGDLVEAVRKSGGVFSAAGSNINELAALFTSVRSTTRESASAIATGLRTITARLQRPRTIKFLKDIGIDLQEEGQFVGMFEAVRRLNKELKSLDPQDVRYAQIVEKIAGFRQISRAIPLIQQFEKAERALIVAEAGSLSVARDAAIAQENLSIKLQKLGEVWNKLYNDIVSSNTFKILADYAINFGKVITNLIRNFEPILPLLGGTLALKGVGLARQFAGGFGMGLTGFSQATKENTKSNVQNTQAIQQLTNTVRGVATGATGAVGSTVGRKGVVSRGLPSGVLAPPIGGHKLPGRFNMPYGIAQQRSAGYLGMPYGFAPPIGKAYPTPDRSFRTINRTKSTFMQQESPGGGALNNIFLVSLFSGVTQSLFDFDDGIGKAINSLTKLIIVIEGSRFAIGALSGLRGGLISGSGTFARSNFGRGMGMIGAGLFGGGMAGFSGEGTSSRGRRLRTGFRLAGPTLGNIGIAAGVGGGLLLGGSRQNEALKLAKEEANAGEARLRELEQMNKGGIIISGVAAGAGIGAAVGSIIPGVGTGIGAGVGAVGGLIYGALQDNTAEIRALNRESRFTNATEVLSKRMGELLSGRSRILGTDLDEVGEQLRAANRAIVESFTAGDITEAKQREAAITKSLVQFDELKKSLIGVSDNIEEFGKAGNFAGRALIETIASIRGISIEKVTKEIEKDIKIRVEEEKRVKKLTIAFEKFGSSIDILQTFGSALSESNQQLVLFSKNMEFGAKLARGNFAEIEFRGRPGLNQFSRVASGHIFDERMFVSALEQAVGSLPNEISNKFVKETTEMARFARELPQILEIAGASGPLGADYVEVALAKQLEKFSGGKAGILADIVEQSVGSMIGREGGMGVFFEKMRNSKEFAQELLGKDFKNYLKELDSISKEIINKLKIYLGGVNQQVQLQNEIVGGQLSIIKTIGQTKKELFELARPGESFSLSRAENMFARQQQFLLRNVRGVGGGASPQQLGVKLINVNKELKKLELELQNVTKQSKFKAITDEMSKLGNEAHLITTALKNFGDVAMRTSIIMDEINKLEEARKAKFGLVERYVSGDMLSRQQILRTIYNTIGVVRGKINLEDLLPDMRKEVIGFMKEFSNVSIAAFGGKRGQDVLGPAVFGSRALGRVQNKLVQRMFGGLKTVGDAAKQFAQPTQRSQEENVLIKKLGEIYSKREIAELQLIKNLQSYHKDLTTSLKLQVDRIGDEVAKALLKSQQIKLGHRIVPLEAKFSAISEVIGKRRSALDILRGFGSQAGFDKSFLQSDAFEKTMSEIVSNITTKTSEIERIKKAEVFDIGDIIKRTKGGKAEIFNAFQRALGRDYGLFMTEKELLGGFKQELIGTQFFDIVSKSFMGTEEELQKVLDMALMDIVKAYSIKPMFSNEMVNILSKGILSNEVKKSAQSATKDLLKNIIPVGKLDDNRYAKLFDVIIKNISQISQLSTNLPPDTSVKKLNEELKTFELRINTLTRELNALQFPHGRPLPRPKKPSVVVPNKVINAFNKVGEEEFGFKKDAKIGGFAMGGIAHGTDTVPAMLTPGEFVVNRAATQRFLPLLQSINQGQGVRNVGGVQFAQGGGFISGFRHIGAGNKIKDEIRKLQQDINQAQRAGKYRRVSDLIKKRKQLDYKLNKVLLAEKYTGKKGGLGKGPDDLDRAVRAANIKIISSIRAKTERDKLLKNRGIFNQSPAAMAHGRVQMSLQKASDRNRRFLAQKRDIEMRIANATRAKQHARMTGQPIRTTQAAFGHAAGRAISNEQLENYIGSLRRQLDSLRASFKNNRFQAGGVVGGGNVVSGGGSVGMGFERFERIITNFNSGIEKFGGMVQQMKDALGQEITMNVQHGAIDLRVDADVSGIDGLKDFVTSYVQQEVGKAIDDFSSQIRETGPR